MNEGSVFGSVVFVWAAMAVGGYGVFAIFRRLPWTLVPWKLMCVVGAAVFVLGLIGQLLTGTWETTYQVPLVAVWPAIFLKNLQLKADRDGV